MLKVVYLHPIKSEKIINYLQKTIKNEKNIISVGIDVGFNWLVCTSWNAKA